MGGWFVRIGLFFILLNNIKIPSLLKWGLTEFSIKGKF